MIYKLNRDVGEYKKGMIVDDVIDWNNSLHRALTFTWLTFGWLDLVEEKCSCPCCLHRSKGGGGYGTCCSSCCHLERNRKWNPKEYQKYWAIGGYGDLFENTNKYDDTDIKMFEYGNVFRTKEEAERARDLIKELLTKNK